MTDIRALRSQANSLKVTVHVGKSGITDATVGELQRHLKAQKLVKVRLLPAATDGGANDQEQAEALAKASASRLIEVRGHTAVFHKA